MTEGERVLLALVAAATTLGAVELVRREYLAWRQAGEPWWRLDAAAMGAAYASISAAVLWVLVLVNTPPVGGLVGLIAWLAVLVALLVADDRTR